MAEPYEYLTTFLIALLPCAAGLQIVRWLLPGERRLLVVGGLGGGLGIGLVTFGIGALVQIVPLLAAAVLVNSASALLVGWLICQWRRDPLRLDLGRWTWLVGTLLLLVLFIAGVEFVSSIWHANTHENLLIRLGLAAHFLAGNWPPAHPWEPDTIFFYRFGAPLWTAAVALLGGADVFAAGLAVTLVSVLACLWGVAAAVTLLSDKITGLLAGFLVAVAGPQNFLALPNAPFGELTASTAQKLVDIGPARLQEGYVLGESFQQLVPFSYTLVVGLAAAAGVGALAVAVSAGNARLLASLLVGSLAFAGMSVTAEHLLPVMAAALVLAAPVLFLTNRRGQAMALVGLALAGSLLAIIPEGPLAQIVRGPASAGFLSLNASSLFTVPTHGIFPEPSLFTSTVPAPQAGVLDPVTWKGFGWVLIAISGSGLVAVARGRAGLAAPAIAGLIALLIPGILHDELNPWNTWRFTQAGLLLAAPALAILVTAVWRWSWIGRRPARVAAVGLVGLAAGTWLVSLSLLPGVVRTPESTVLEDELAAARYAAQLDYPQRALLLPGPRTFIELSSSMADGMHKYAVSFGRLQVPMGFDNRGARERYAHAYAKAQDRLLPEDLRDLEVNLVYTAQNHLSLDQRLTIDQALARGTLTPVFTSPGGARVIYRVVSNDDG